MLEAKGLAVGFGKKTIVRDISLEVSPGDWLGLIGPNGCGKTTLLKTLAGILRPIGGSVLWQGQNLSDRPADNLARLFAYLPQVPNQEVPYTVAEMIELGRAPYHRYFSKAEKGLVQEIMRLFRLDDLADQPVTKISGGQFQRVILARTLAQTPKVLFLDEPTAHLDPGQGIEILLTIKELMDKKKRLDGLNDVPLAVVSAFHDLNLAWQFSNKLVLLDQGRVVKAGPSDEVLTEKNIQDAYGPHVRRRRDAETGQPIFIASGHSRVF